MPRPNGKVGAPLVGSRVPRDRSEGPRSVAALKGLIAAALLAALAGGAWWWASGREGTKGTKTTKGTMVTATTNIAQVPSIASVASVQSSAPAKPAPAGQGVQLWEGGPYWATTNIGAEKPEDSGYYFWWGDGRPSRTRTAATPTNRTSIRATTARATTTATSGGLFVLSKGSPSSERSERIRFFNSSIL